MKILDAVLCGCTIGTTFLHSEDMHKTATAKRYTFSTDASAGQGVAAVILNGELQIVDRNSLTAEDLDDLLAIQAAKLEGGYEPYDVLRRQLGLAG